MDAEPIEDEEPFRGLDPIVTRVDESLEWDRHGVFEMFPLSGEVRDQLAALLLSDSTQETKEISQAILTTVMTLEAQLVPELISQQAKNLEFSRLISDRLVEINQVYARLLELEARILQAGVRLPTTAQPRLTFPDYLF